jgi:predicted nuclease with RNAse H fold
VALNDRESAAVMTIGVDLSAQPKETAACTLTWADATCNIEQLVIGLDDDAIIDLVEVKRPTKIGIDAPFGWPVPFVQALSLYTETGEWPESGDNRRRLRLRSTDIATIDETGGPPPLSVSSDRIAVCAMRCAELLGRLAGTKEIDRTGVGTVVEVYPAAALRQWGCEASGYKGGKPEQQRARESLTQAIASATVRWLKLDDEHRQLLTANDHLLDALVAALVARATELALSIPIPEAMRGVAAREGWIHLPLRQPLSQFWPFAATAEPD